MSAYDLVSGADSLTRPGAEVVEALETCKRDARRRRSIGDERELTQLRETLRERPARA